MNSSLRPPKRFWHINASSRAKTTGSPMQSRTALSHAVAPILCTIFQNKLSGKNIASSCHAGNKGAFSLFQCCCNLFRQHCFDLGFTAMQLFRSMPGEAAAILSLFQLRHFHHSITKNCRSCHSIISSETDDLNKRSCMSGSKFRYESNFVKIYYHSAILYNYSWVAMQ